MSDNKRLLFKIETAENMSENKIVILLNPKHKELVSQIFTQIQIELDDFKDKND
jgi:hypothetical protein